MAIEKKAAIIIKIKFLSSLLQVIIFCLAIELHGTMGPVICQVKLVVVTRASAEHF